MNSSANKLRSVFLVGFLLTIALALTSYIDSSFVGTYVSVKSVGVLFSLGSIATIIFLAYLPSILKIIGIRGVFHLTAGTYLLSILAMIYTNNALLFQAFFVIYLAAGIGIYFTIDLLIEHFSKKGSTGSTRGIYLAIYNLAFLIGPLLAGTILVNNSFEIVYLTAGMFIIIMFLVFMKDLEKIELVSAKKDISFTKIISRFLRSNNLFNVYIVSLMLSFFFSWMAVYTPIYLNMFLGFDWQQIGVMFAIMHIPYITLEVPIGRLADKYRCEKNMMSLGLIIIALSTAALGLFADGSFWSWAIGLTLTRVGASFVQVGSESYFFRKVDAEDSYMIAMFRNAAPVAYILGPLVATLVLTLTEYRGLFIVLGCVMLTVLFFSSRLSRIK